MSNPPPALPQMERATTLVNRFLCGLVWATQAGAAFTYLAVADRPAAWQRMFAKDPVSVFFVWLSAAAMVLLWAAGLWDEWRRFYDRQFRLLSRKAGLIGHGGVLLIAAAAASEQPHRVGLWIVLGIMASAALVTWALWMQARFLPDEDQAVIDVILSREARQRAAVYDASEREKRRARLSGIVAGLGYELTDRGPAVSKPAEAPSVKWPIPAGKHKPLVYFIRNGNRMKIGTTVELKRRIRTLALRAENVALLVDGGQQRERQFHKQFAEHRIGNTEWFAYEGPLADYVHDQISRASQNGKGQ